MSHKLINIKYKHLNYKKYPNRKVKYQNLI